MADLADVMRALQALQAGQAVILAQLAAKRDDAARAACTAPHRPAVSAGDRAVMRALLPLILEYPLATMFETGEVLALAELEPRVEQALRPLRATGGDAGKRLGRLLKRCAGSAFGGCELRLLQDRSPLLFKVEPVSNPPETR